MLFDKAQQTKLHVVLLSYSEALREGAITVAEIFTSR